MNYSIRGVREEDAELIVDLLNPIISEGAHTVMKRELSVEDQLDFIRGLPERGVYKLAICRDTQRVLGIQDLLPFSSGSGALDHVGEVSTFVCLSSHRKGIGRALMQSTLEAARQLGFREDHGEDQGRQPTGARLLWQSGVQGRGHG